MRPCIECGEMTEGSIGAAGMKWAGLCQPCKDKADGELAQSIARTAAAIDYVLPRCFPTIDAYEALRQPTPTPTTPEAA